MRIIGGSLRGRRLLGEPSANTRPTRDRVREAIASALDARGLVQSARVLDLFAGTGAFGFEALSRGAERVVALDGDAAAIACIVKNAHALGLAARLRALRVPLLGTVDKVAKALERSAEAPFTLVFADPPYAESEQAAALLAALAARGLLAMGAVVVFEHATKEPPTRPACFATLATYGYGSTGVQLWEMIAPKAQT